MKTLNQLFMPSLEKRKYAAIFALPVKNEVLILEKSIRTVYNLAGHLLPSPWSIVVAVNDSTDNTLAIAKRLAKDLTNLSVRYLAESGKGRAIRDAWNSVDADYYFFSDIDLSVDWGKALPQMLRALQEGADIVVGSRALAESVVARPMHRKALSLGYRLLSHLVTGTRLTDLPCGCKGINAKVAKELLPQIQNNDWFFDSELLLLAERNGYKIVEVPLVWEEYRYAERPKKLSLIRVSFSYLRELWRLRKGSDKYPLNRE